MGRFCLSVDGLQTINPKYLYLLLMGLFDRFLAFHHRHRWLSHAGYWLIYLLVSVSASKYADGNKGTYAFEFISDALYMSTEMIGAYVTAYVLIPKLFYHKHYLAAASGFILLSYLVSVLARIAIVKICEPMAGIAPKAFETYGEILTDLPKLLYVYYFQIIAGALVFVFFKTFKGQFEAQKRALQLEKEKAEAELRLLKNQLNPHFLFNTLNNIYSLSFTGSTATSESIARLSEILDHILYRSNEVLTPLEAEIMLIRNYIELEKLRYGKRLTVKMTNSDTTGIRIPPLVLLSLVENAFKHGASEDAGAPVITIEMQADGKNFRFVINNTAANTAKEESKGIGLPNLRRQLELIYQQNYQLTVERGTNWFKVALTLPK